MDTLGRLEDTMVFFCNEMQRPNLNRLNYVMSIFSCFLDSCLHLEGGGFDGLENLIDDDNTTCAAIPGADVFKEFKLNFTCVSSITETSPVDQLQIEVNLKTQDTINCDETLKLYCKRKLKNPDCSTT